MAWKPLVSGFTLLGPEVKSQTQLPPPPTRGQLCRVKILSGWKYIFFIFWTGLACDRIQLWAWIRPGWVGSVSRDGGFYTRCFAIVGDCFLKGWRYLLAPVGCWRLVYVGSLHYEREDPGGKWSVGRSKKSSDIDPVNSSLVLSVLNYSHLATTLDTFYQHFFILQFISSYSFNALW